jgi:archaeal flagellar protein FlaJ
MFEELKRNLAQEKKILNDLRALNEREVADKVGAGGGIYAASRASLLKQMKMLNDAVPALMKAISPVRVLPGGEGSAALKNVPARRKPVGVAKFSYVSPASKEKKYVSLKKEDKKNFVKTLKVSEGGLSSFKKLDKKAKKDVVAKPSAIAMVSNRFFRRTSEKLVPKFGSLTEDLKKANIHFLTSTYIAITLFASMLAFIFGWVVFALVFALGYGGWWYLVTPFALAALSMMGFYFYPNSERNSVQKKIVQELPFATIHMAAIAGSDIEPTKIFRIIAMSKEYPNVGKEIRKVINQLEIYGYDIVTSLKNVARTTSSKKLAELFSGMATNISSGGALKSYLEKKSENYLLDYKLERRKYSDLAGTFMDIYISILIAAPLVLMMMFIVMNVSGLELAGFGISTLLMLSIGGVVLVNIIFLIVLNAKQPKV